MGYKGGDPEEENDFRNEFDRLMEITNEQTTKKKFSIGDICEFFSFKFILQWLPEQLVNLGFV